MHFKGRPCLTKRLALIAIPVLSIGDAGQPAGEVADTICKNGKIYTVNGATPALFHHNRDGSREKGDEAGAAAAQA